MAAVLGLTSISVAYGSVLSRTNPVCVLTWNLYPEPSAKPGNEEFPHPGRAEDAHRMATAIPAVEVPDHADASRRRRPDGELHAAHAVHLRIVGAEFLVDPRVVALVEEIEVEIGQRRQERVRVVERRPRLLPEGSASACTARHRRDCVSRPHRTRPDGSARARTRTSRSPAARGSPMRQWIRGGMRGLRGRKRHRPSQRVRRAPRTGRDDPCG